jgi:hypothetical protein
MRDLRPNAEVFAQTINAGTAGVQWVSDPEIADV